MRSKIEEKVVQEVQRTIRKHNMLKGVKKALIAFSSGPDSICLLDALHSLCGKKIEFHLVYVNHGLRPKNTLKNEEKLTKKYALQYNINHTIIKVNIEKKKIGIEAAAREARYKKLLSCMKMIDAQRIVLGHNLDDVLETFFMNLLRGSGTRGLKSIPPVRLPFIRPLVNVKKNEILKFLEKRRLSYSLDETNRRLNYRRNLLRHKIIPQLAKINPVIHETIKREIEILRQDDEYLEKQARRTYTRVATKGNNYTSLDLKRILRYNPSIISRVVMKAIKELRGDLDGYENKHFDEIISLKDKETGKKINLPKGLYAQREYGTIGIGVSKLVKPIKVEVKTECELQISGNIIIRTRVVSNFDLKKRNQNCEVFDLNKIEPPLFSRNRKKGDYIEAKIGKKTVKNVFNEFKVPPHRRDEIMMLCDQRSILWIVDVLRAFRGFIDKKTKKILVVEFEYIN